jgi:hypothetical protein
VVQLLLQLLMMLLLEMMIYHFRRIKFKKASTIVEAFFITSFY